MHVTIAELEAAAKGGTLEAALEGILGTLDSVDQDQLVRVARLHGPTWERHPDRFVEDFYLRTLGIERLAAARARWVAEMDKARPWVRALRPLSTPSGLVAQLTIDAPMRLCQGSAPRFESEERVVFGSASADDPDDVVWTWADGTLERRPARPQPSYPRLEQPGRLPRLRRAADSEPIELPWPEDATCHARLSFDRNRIFQFGGYGFEDDEDLLGLARELDVATLEVLRERRTVGPVERVVEGPEPGEITLITCFGTLIDGEEERRLHVGGNIGFSPGGRYVCSNSTFDAAIWERASLAPSDHALDRPLVFSPDGRRLIEGDTLYDGRTGAVINRIAGDYFTDSRHLAWFHLGDRYLVRTNGLETFDAASGEPLTFDDRHPLDWHVVACDRDGARCVGYDRRTKAISFMQLPGRETLHRFELDFRPKAIGLSDDAQRIGLASSDRTEVRTAKGEVVFRRDHDEEERWITYGTHPSSRTILFALDATTMAVNIGHSVFEVFDLETGDVIQTVESRDELDQLPGYLRPTPPGWTVSASGGLTIFEHTPSGTRATVPMAGPFVANPAAPTILARSGAFLFELRG